MENDNDNLYLMEFHHVEDRHSKVNYRNSLIKVCQVFTSSAKLVDDGGEGNDCSPTIVEECT